MATGETEDHGPLIAPPTVWKEERGRGREQERALILLHREMDLTVLEKTPTNMFVGRNISLFLNCKVVVDIVQCSNLFCKFY